MRYSVIYIGLVLAILVACQPAGPLPIIGPSSIQNGDTIYHTIDPFEFVNQQNKPINNQKLKDNIYIADFFFTSCPSICPRVRIEMLKIYDTFETHPDIKLVSHTLDPRNDTPERLKRYADNLEVSSDKWYFLTGEKDDLMEISRSYFVSALDDPDAPGGIEHSGRILLIDKTGHIRAYSEGTDPSQTSGFIRKVKQLLKEYD